MSRTAVVFQLIVAGCLAIPVAIGIGLAYNFATVGNAPKATQTYDQVMNHSPSSQSPQDNSLACPTGPKIWLPPTLMQPTPNGTQAINGTSAPNSSGVACINPRGPRK